MITLLTILCIICGPVMIALAVALFRAIHKYRDITATAYLYNSGSSESFDLKDGPIKVSQDRSKLLVIEQLGEDGQVSGYVKFNKVDS